MNMFDTQSDIAESILFLKKDFSFSLIFNAKGFVCKTCWFSVG